MPASMKHLNKLVDDREHPSGDKTKKKKKNKCITAVLAKWRQDQKFYSCEIIVCDKKDRKCKVRFEDDLECWIEASEIHLQMSLDDMGDELIVCCVCDDGKSDEPNQLVICDSCNQSYHLECHKPTLDGAKMELGKDEFTWTCATCSQLLNLPDATSSQAGESTTIAPGSQKIKTENIVKKKVKKEEKVEDMEVEEVAKEVDKEGGKEAEKEKEKEAEKEKEKEAEKVEEKEAEKEKETSSNVTASAKKSRAMKPKSLNTGSQKTKKVEKKEKTPKIKLANGAGKDKKEKKEANDEMIPSTASLTEKLCE